MRQVQIPVHTLLAFVGGSDADTDELIAGLMGRQLFDQDVDDYLMNHFSGDSERLRFAQDTVAAWRKQYCEIPSHTGIDYRATLVTIDPYGARKKSSRFVAKSDVQARELAAAYFGIDIEEPLLFIERANSRVDSFGGKAGS